MKELEPLVYEEEKRYTSFITKRKGLTKYLDPTFAMYGGCIMGATVFGINYTLTNNLEGSLTAGAKQSVYSAVIGGAIMRMTQYIALSIKHQTKAIILSTVIPSLLTLMLTYGLHNLKGTPKPLESTLPTALVLPSAAIVGYKKRKAFELMYQDSKK